MVDLGDRFDRMDSRLVQVETGPNGLKSKVAKTDVDLTAVEQLPRLMIQVTLKITFSTDTLSSPVFSMKLLTLLTTAINIAWSINGNS